MRINVVNLCKVKRKQIFDKFESHALLLSFIDSMKDWFLFRYVKNFNDVVKKKFLVMHSDEKSTKFQKNK